MTGRVSATSAAPSPLRTVVAATAAIGGRPDLWLTALRSYRGLVPAGWWRRRPHLPLPDARWLRFRMVTAYGGAGRPPGDSALDGDDLITWLEWARRWPG